MAKKKLKKWEIELMRMDEEGIAYLEYNDKVGGEPYGRCIGAPYVEDVAELYRECISQGKSWQELLNVVGCNFDEIPD